MNGKPILKFLHLWVGLTLGGVLSICAISGGILIYKTSLLERQYPALSSLEMTGPGAPLKTHTILKRIVEHHHAHELTMIHLPGPEQQHFEVWLNRDGDNHIEYVDPFSAEMVLTRSPDRDWLMWLYDLHSTLLAGDLGEQVLGLAAFGFVLVLVSGVLLWWPGVKRWRHNLAPPRSKRLFPWLHWGHRTTGVVSLPLLITAILTGMGMIYYTPLQNLLVSALNRSSPEPKPSSINCSVDHAVTSWESQLVKVSKALPSARLIRVYPAKGPNQPVRYRLKFPREWHQNGRSYVFLNPCDNSVVYRHDARKALLGIRAMNLIYPLHSVHVGGQLYKIAATIMAALPVLLMATGLFFWARRRSRT